MHSCVKIQAVVDDNAVVLNCLIAWMRPMSVLMFDLIVAAHSQLVQLSLFVSQRMDRNLNECQREISTKSVNDFSYDFKCQIYYYYYFRSHLIHHQLKYFVMAVVAVAAVDAAVGKSFASDYFVNYYLYEIDSHYLDTVVASAMHSILAEYLPNAISEVGYQSNL